MKQPNTQRLRALRLSALARDNKVVDAMRSSITQAPDALVKELMDVHGWPAHEALCAVQQLQQEVLDDTAEQASAWKKSFAMAKNWLGDWRPGLLLTYLK